MTFPRSVGPRPHRQISSRSYVRQPTNPSSRSKPSSRNYPRHSITGPVKPFTHETDINKIFSHAQNFKPVSEELLTRYKGKGREILPTNYPISIKEISKQLEDLDKKMNLILKNLNISQTKL